MGRNLYTRESSSSLVYLLILFISYILYYLLWPIWILLLRPWMRWGMMIDFLFYLVCSKCFYQSYCCSSSGDWKLHLKNPALLESIADISHRLNQKSSEANDLDLDLDLIINLVMQGFPLDPSYNFCVYFQIFILQNLTRTPKHCRI